MVCTYVYERSNIQTTYCFNIYYMYILAFIQRYVLFPYTMLTYIVVSIRPIDLAHPSHRILLLSIYCWFQPNYALPDSDTKTSSLYKTNEKCCFEKKKKKNLQFSFTKYVRRKIVFLLFIYTYMSM